MSLLMKELECPVCTAYMVGLRQPRICTHGHACCSSCRRRLASCPTCRSREGWSRCLPLLSCRCLALENLGAALLARGLILETSPPPSPQPEPSTPPTEAWWVDYLGQRVSLTSPPTTWPMAPRRRRVGRSGGERNPLRTEASPSTPLARPLNHAPTTPYINLASSNPSSLTSTPIHSPSDT